MRWRWTTRSATCGAPSWSEGIMPRRSATPARRQGLNSQEMAVGGAQKILNLPGTVRRAPAASLHI
jgi:hypothetical protein